MEKNQHPAEVALATQIRVEMAARDWTQKELAARVGVTRETLNKYMKGHSSMPMPVYFKLAETFGYSPRGFMELVEARVPEGES